MRKKMRKQQVLKRKNFFPTLLITIILWVLTAGVIYFADPRVFGMIPFFFILVFITVLFTFSLIFASGRRGLIGAVAVVLFLILSYLGVGNILNLVLIVAIATAIELYFSLR